MATKWKGWTAHLAVKLVAFALIPVLAFTTLCMAYDIVDTNDFDSALLFVNFENNSYFYQRYVVPDANQLEILLTYGDEESIQAGKHIEVLDDYTLHDTAEDSRWAYDSISERNVGQSRLKHQQLQRFRIAKQMLSQQQGLLYYAKRGSNVFSNTEKQSRDFFQSQTVHVLMENGRFLPGNEEAESNLNLSLPEDSVLYLAYDNGYVRERTNAWLHWQQNFFLNLGTLSAQPLAILVAFVVLLAGAGRRRRDDGAEVHLTVLDKPFLDVSFAATLIFVALVATLISELAWQMDYYGSRVPVYVLLGVGVVGIGLPVLGWLLGFAKRWKRREVFSHTLIFWVLKQAVGLAQSLWSGVPLMLKALVAGGGLFCALVLGAFAPPTLVIAFPILFLAILWFCRRLYLVVTGALLARQGIYNPPIPVTGGELGKIAQSINEISSGIELAVAEKLKSERFKTELITNVSHDIRTPLTAIITYSDLLKTEGLDSEKAPEYLDILIQKAQRLRVLTDELFEASKAATGNVEVVLEKLDLSVMVGQCLGEMDERVQQSGLDFRVDLPTSAMVVADGRLLWRVMENLLSNVFKYSMPNSRVYLSVQPAGFEWLLELKNMSEYPLNVNPMELTERFKRGDEARSSEGSGLGLSIVQSFVQVQGGRFELSIDGDLFKTMVFLPRADAGKSVNEQKERGMPL